MTLSLREQRAQRIMRRRLERIALRDLAAWGEYHAFCDAYRDGALTCEEYEAREPSEWHRLRGRLNEHASERRMLLVETGRTVEPARIQRYADERGRRV